MPPPRPLLLLPKTATTTVARRYRHGQRYMSSSSSGSHSHYDPPSGWFLNVPPGEKPVKEGWENVFYWGFFGGLFAAGVAYAYKPDTSIQTWALEEARRRLEVEGILEDPTTGAPSKHEIRTVSGLGPGGRKA